MNMLSEEELNEIVDVVCMTVLDMPVHPGGQDALQAGEYLTASIAISGGWSGVVKVRASIGLLNHAAAHVFSIGAEEVEPRDRIDTITELTNMLGGTVKCMLPANCDLALPEIVPGEKKGRERHEWTYFRCDTLPLAVAVVDSVSGLQAA